MPPHLARLSLPAKRWLEREIAYLATSSPGAARKLIAKLREAREHLAAHPRMGQPGVIQGSRRLVVGPYVLTIRQGPGVIEIVAIRHARQADAYAPEEAAADRSGGKE